ncbi:unnamed protein product, partial [Iphiclides podalirius]
MADGQPGGIGAQIGNAITGKLTESIKSMDVMSLLQNIMAATPHDEESQAIKQRLQGVMRQYTEMSEEEKVQFATQLKEALASKLQAKLQDVPLDLSGLNEAIGNAIMYKLALVAFGAFVVFVAVVFFGYKLYKSIKDKEKKREEKKKAKQMKKKK